MTGEASVNCVSPSGTNVFAYDSNLPNCSANPNWDTQKAKFQGNLENGVNELNLPIKRLDEDLVETIRRGKNVGDLANVGGSVVSVSAATQDKIGVSRERFSNKFGLRISLADSQYKLPGCAGVAAGAICGARLDAPLGSGSIGYRPLAMSDGYQATALNATRMAVSGREIWIKVEMVAFSSTITTPTTRDITADMLSLGVTEPIPLSAGLSVSGYTSQTDSRSIIKMQRFAMEGPSIPDTGTTSYLSNFSIGSTSTNLAVRYSGVTSDPSTGCSGCTAVDSFAPPFPGSSAHSNATAGAEDAAHLKWANINSSGLDYAIVPFPIQLYDAREGLQIDDQTWADTTFGTGYVPANGNMSLVDIDVANLRRFLMGDFDGLFPTNTPYAVAEGDSLRAADVPEEAGWVVYFSDRRGDADFDGEFDMEDVLSDGILQFSEDLNKNSVLDVDYTNEAPGYSTAVERGRAATADHKYYRRGVRLINATTLPGNYDNTNSGLTRGFTFASENGVYVLGNYNATGVALPGGTGAAPSSAYLPADTTNHIPAAIAGDAVTILSNSWADSNAFANPFSSGSRVASDTQVRFAMLAGDGITGVSSGTISPSTFGQLNGGVHNFKRFLETWSSSRLNYAGSLINLYNSRNNNGHWKCCTTTYVPPVRDWTFDSTFLDPERLPPGTPYLYAISFTGFQRISN